MEVRIFRTPMLFNEAVLRLKTPLPFPFSLSFLPQLHLLLPNSQTRAVIPNHRISLTDCLRL